MWYAKNMWGFSKKRFFVTLGLSIIIWLVSIIVQGLTLHNVTFSLLGSSCQLTGFPIALCMSGSLGEIPFWVVHIINIFFWFWVIHLFWGWFEKRQS